jgi:tetratricopeptide (TPR) repeat protein
METPKAFVSTGKLRISLFLGLALLFAAALAAIRHWGEPLAMRAYQPMLQQELAKARAAGNYGAAETLLLCAVQTTPGYAYTLVDTVVFDLPVMPRLADALVRVYQNDVQRAGTPWRAHFNIMRVHYARGAFSAVLAVPPPYECPPAVRWQIDRLRSVSTEQLTDGAAEPVNPALPFAFDAEDLVPEIRSALAPYTELSGNGSTRDRYLRAAALFELGRYAEARVLLEALIETQAATPDAAFRLGRIAERHGDTERAYALYAEAVARGRAHLDAAVSCLRLADSCRR